MSRLGGAHPARTINAHLLPEHIDGVPLGTFGLDGWSGLFAHGLLSFLGGGANRVLAPLDAIWPISLRLAVKHPMPGSVTLVRVVVDRGRPVDVIPVEHHLEIAEASVGMNGGHHRWADIARVDAIPDMDLYAGLLHGRVNTCRRVRVSIATVDTSRVHFVQHEIHDPPWLQSFHRALLVAHYSPSTLTASG